MQCNKYVCAKSIVMSQMPVHDTQTERLDMTRHAQSELLSILQQLDSIQMTESERQAAMAAARNACTIVEWCAGALAKIGKMRTPPVGKPSLGH